MLVSFKKILHRIIVLIKRNGENNTVRKKTRKPFSFKKQHVYRLRGYSTTSRVDKKVMAEQNHRMLRNFLIAAVFVLVIAILLFIFNPLKDLRELFRMIGI